jgi:hypothetical protein
MLPRFDAGGGYNHAGEGTFSLYEKLGWLEEAHRLVLASEGEIDP